MGQHLAVSTSTHNTDEVYSTGDKTLALNTLKGDNSDLKVTARRHSI